MKYSLAFVIVLTLGGNMMAQDTTAPAAPQPDYSREKLTQIFSNEPVREPVEPNVQFHLGYIDFKALNMRWRLAYFPLLALPGSMPWAYNGAMGAIPDPFELTNTQFASPPRTWRQLRDMNAELRRIEKSERAKAKVVAKPE